MQSVMSNDRSGKRTGRIPGFDASQKGEIMALAHQEPPEGVSKPVQLYVDRQISEAKQVIEQRLVDHRTEIERYYAVRYDEVLVEVRATRADQSRIFEILQDQYRTLNAHTKTLDAHTKTLNAHTETLNAHSERLDAITERLDAHTETLNAHSERLDAITERLDAHTETLNAHSDRLDAITERLDAHTETLNAIIEILRDLQSRD